MDLLKNCCFLSNIVYLPLLSYQSRKCKKVLEDLKRKKNNNFNIISCFGKLNKFIRKYTAVSLEFLNPLSKKNRLRKNLTAFN